MVRLGSIIKHPTLAPQAAVLQCFAYFAFIKLLNLMCPYFSVAAACPLFMTTQAGCGKDRSLSTIPSILVHQTYIGSWDLLISINSCICMLYASQGFQLV